MKEDEVMISNRTIEKMESKRRNHKRADIGSRRQTQKEKAFKQQLEIRSFNYEKNQEAEVKKS